jgi:hypothetical protein
LIDSINSSFPFTLRKEDCCPANEAAGKSSAVAELLSAHNKSILFG